MTFGRLDGIGRPAERQDGARHQKVSLVAVGLVCGLLCPGAVRAQGADSLRLIWLAPADLPGPLSVSAYDVRVSDVPITVASWAAGRPAPTATPRAPGLPETLVVRGLEKDRTYWLAIRSQDRAGNWSMLSNVLRYTVPGDRLDTSPPAAPESLAAERLPAMAAVRVSWRASPEPDLAAYAVYRSADGGGTWRRLVELPPSLTDYADLLLPEGADRLWYAVTASDRAGNESARSAPVVVVSRAAYVRVPAAWRLDAPYPNPARVGADVRLPLESPASRAAARLRIFDPAGQIVRELDASLGSLGAAEFIWDGRNAHGLACAPGVYRAELMADGVRLVRRIARVP